MNSLLKRVLLSGGVLLGSAAMAHATNIMIDFEGAADFEFLNTAYAGGSGSDGFVGTNFGVTFNGAQAHITGWDDAGTDPLAGPGSGNFANMPSYDTGMFSLNETTFRATVAGGFTGVSFSYVSISNADSGSNASIGVYDASDTLLGSLTLDDTDDLNASPLVNWTSISPSFSGTASYIQFNGGANDLVIDNLSFTQPTPDTPVPEPASLALLGVALAGAGAAARRRGSAK